MLNDVVSVASSCSSTRIISYPDSAFRDVWKPLWTRLDTLHQDRAVYAYRQAKESAIAEHREVVPQLALISQQLGRMTGFKLLEADGKVDGPTFFGRLAERTFSATTFLRGSDELYFTAQPDWVHEFVGHVVPLHDMRVADLYQHFGQVARGLRTREGMKQLERLYWYSAETGVILENGITKAFGAALLSSVTELEGLSGYERIAFDPLRMANTHYYDNSPQRFVYEARSLSDLLEGLHDYLGFMTHRKNL